MGFFEARTGPTGAARGIVKWTPRASSDVVSSDCGCRPPPSRLIFAALAEGSGCAAGESPRAKPARSRSIRRPRRGEARLLVRGPLPVPEPGATVESMSALLPAETLTWNGRDFPEELRTLPPGTYELRPMPASPSRLSDEEEDGVRRGLDAGRLGRVVSLSEAAERMERAIQRGAARAEKAK